MKYRYQSGSMIYEVSLERHGEGYRVTINGEAYDFEVLDAQPGALTLRLVSHSTDAAEGVARPDRSPDPAGDAPADSLAGPPLAVYWGAEGDVKWLSSGGCSYRLTRPSERRGRSAAPGAPEDTLRAPMPAQVRAVQVAEGDAVEAGQTLLLLEAMKMEIRLQSPRQARVARLLAEPGATVERDQVLVELE